MNPEIKIKEVESLKKKGIKKVVEINPGEITLTSISDVKKYVNELSGFIEKKLGVKINSLEFIGNEDIGSRYILYRFRLYSGKGYIACRIVTYFNKHIQTILTVGDL